jgi:hypothetical protein
LTKRDTVAKAAALRNEVAAFLADLPGDRAEERVGSGKWTPADIVAHLAYWNERLPADLQLCLDDATAPESGYVTNQRVARERADWSLERAGVALTAATEPMLAAIAALPQDHPRFAPALKLAHHEAVEHVESHLAQLRAWRSERAEPSVVEAAVGE